MKSLSFVGIVCTLGLAAIMLTDFEGKMANLLIGGYAIMAIAAVVREWTRPSARHSSHRQTD